MSRTALSSAPGSTAPGALDGVIRQLAALQLGDSAFPSGRYTLSHGLEALAQSGQLAGPGLAPRLLTLLADCIRFGVGPSDGVAVACAHSAAAHAPVDLAAVLEADERLSAVKLAREARDGSARTGRALLRTAETAFPSNSISDYGRLVRTGRTPGNHAVALGVIAASLGVPHMDAVTGELYAFAAGWASAATRLALLDHRRAQALLYRVHPVIADAALDACTREVTQMASCTPLLDTMSMRHEDAELRLFAN